MIKSSIPILLATLIKLAIGHSDHDHEIDPNLPNNYIAQHVSLPCYS